MSISVIVNGYYRSGTTLMWKVLHDNHDHVVLYEPLNPDLGTHLDAQDKPDGLHGYNLWESYNEISFETRQALVDNLPTYEKRCLTEKADAIKYLDIIDQAPIPTIIQTNRLHYLMLDAHEKYKCKVIHIIRHPSDVLSSIERASYISYQSKVKIIYKWIMGHTELCFDKFFIRKEFETIRRFESLKIQSNKKASVISSSNQLQRIFSIVWIYSNYRALQLTEQCGGLIITFRDIVNRPSSVGELVTDYIGCETLRLNRYTKDKETSRWSNLTSWMPNDVAERLECKINYIASKAES
jgi:hypothetical protein